MADFLLIINPGSTSTKVALFDGYSLVDSKVVRHDSKEISKFDNVADQLEFRIKAINLWVDSLSVDLKDLKAIVGRGAPLKPLDGGSYEIGEQMLSDLQSMKYSNHASNLGAIIADQLGVKHSVPSFISDPITVDNFTDLARISGIPEIERKCRVHALNIKEVCRRVAVKSNSKLEDQNYIAVHMGGGISVAALKGGKVIDVNDALLGMGPFSPDRAGALPIGGLVKLCYSGKYTESEMVTKLSRESGLVAYLGKGDLMEVEAMIDNGDEKALLYFNAMAYQIAKEIGVAAVALAGDFSAIVLTGGMANSERLVSAIAERVMFLGQVLVIPGELEMEALAAAGMRVLNGEETPKQY